MNGSVTIRVGELPNWGAGFQPAAAAGYKPAPQLNALFMSRRDYASLYPLIARHIR